MPVDETIPTPGPTPESETYAVQTATDATSASVMVTPAPHVGPRKLISVITPCYNEEDNVEALYEAVKAEFAKLPQYDYEHIFIDNCSRDRTQEILREICGRDKNVRAIFNARNFGQVRSPMHAIYQSQGEAVVGLACDFQDPPELIPQFLAKWEHGYKVVLGVKTESQETPLFFLVRGAYYSLLNLLSEVSLVQHATGFGLYDKRVVEIARQIGDPVPYFRGLVVELGLRMTTIAYKQPLRQRGLTKNNFFTLYDIAMLGFTSYTKMPLRMAALAGLGMSLLSLLLAFMYLILKLTYWYDYPAGMAPLLIGLFFFSSVQLFFTGILGEYILAILQHVQKRPLVVEAERKNFPEVQKESWPSVLATADRGEQ